MKLWEFFLVVSTTVIVRGLGNVVRVSVEEQIRELEKANVTCQGLIEKESGQTNETFCERVWDTVACWPPTQAGQLAKIPCPYYINGFVTKENAYKLCTDNGTWFYHPVFNLTWTDYTQCQKMIDGIPALIQKHLPYIILIFNIGYGISLVCLVAATVIMLSFRRLRCPRNTIHINLFASFILRASVSFMKENLLVSGLAFQSDVREVNENHEYEFIQEGTHWGCKLFFTIFNYILATNYIWILVEGLYLNMLITVTVFSEKSGVKWFMIFGWACPLLFVLPWVIVRAKLDDTLCWNTHSNNGYFWIMRGPIVVSVVINFIIFLNIIRVLFTKLTAFNSFETKKFRYRKLAKSTMVLIPLFGVHYVVFAGLPDNVSDEAELVKLYFEMFFNSIQGFVVSLLFCFLNGEVQTEVIKKWRRFNMLRDNGGLNSHRDTVLSYVSRARGSVESDSDGENKHTKESDIELQKLTNGEDQSSCTKTLGQNGHIRFSDESAPML